MKTVAAVVALARSMAGGDYLVSKYRLTILGEGETISFNGVTHTNTVLFDTNDLISDPYVPESNYLPFQVITSEDRATSLIFANVLRITGDALFIVCNGSVTVTTGSSLSVSGNVYVKAKNLTVDNGSSLSGSGNVYVKAKNLTLTSASSIVGGADIIIDASDTLEMTLGGGISCDGDMVVNAKNIKLLNSHQISNGGSRYFSALKDITMELSTSHLDAATGITDVEAGNNILIYHITGPAVSNGATYPFNMRAGNDITIHSTDWPCNSKENNIAAGGTVRLANTVIPYGANITARNITDVIDDYESGNVVVGQDVETLENLKAMTLVAKDTIEVTELVLKFGIEAVKLICHRLNVAGVINATGSLFIDTDELIINNNLSNIADTSLNLYINAKKATFGSGGNITVNSPRTEGYDEVDIDIANAPTQGYINLDGRLNSLVKIDEIKGSFACYLNEQTADLTHSDRRLLEMLKIYDAYAAADGTSTYQLKGPWSNSASYVLNDFCTFGGDLYICKSAYTSNPDSDNPSIDTTHWGIFFEASLAQEIGYAASGDALGANASISLQAGSSTQWSAHGVISSSTSRLTPEIGTSRLGCVVSQVAAGGHFIIATYKVEPGGAHSLICSTGVLDMPASTGWLNGAVSLISSTNKFVPPNKLIYFVIMTDINGASVVGSSASGNLNLQPYTSAVKTNMGVLTAAPATLTFEGETALRPFVFLRK